MSSSTEIMIVYRSERKYPTDLIHNGHVYERGYRNDSPALKRAINKIRDRVRRAYSAT
jgi:hypothetical protein